MPKRFWEDWRLGVWCADARQAYKEKRLTPGQIEALNDLDFPWKVSVVRLMAQKTLYRACRAQTWI